MVVIEGANVLANGVAAETVAVGSCVIAIGVIVVTIGALVMTAARATGLPVEAGAIGVTAGVEVSSLHESGGFTDNLQTPSLIHVSKLLTLV